MNPFNNEALEHLKSAERLMDDALKEFAVVLVERCEGVTTLNDLYLGKCKDSFDLLYKARERMRRRY